MGRHVGPSGHTVMTTLGETIYHTRISTGMSQADLSTRTGLTQATLSRYENSLRDPNTERLRMLATELGVAGGLLTSLPAFHGAIAGPAHMRRRGAAKATRWRMLEARLNILRIHLGRLADVADLTFSNAIPRINPMAHSAPEAARRVRDQWRLPPGPVESMLGSMEDAGCFVAKLDFGSPRIAALSQWVETRAVVIINSHASADETRLTLAHELGHLVLHSDPEFATVDVEREAAHFAAAFLLPEHDVGRKLANLSLPALHDLRNEWGVSMRTLVERAHALGAIDDRRRNSIYKMLSRRGWLVAEPPSALPPEEPRLLERVVAALEAKGYSEYAIAAIGGFSDVASARRLVPLEEP